MDGHLGKPVKPAQLRDCLAGYLINTQQSQVSHDARRALDPGARQG
jgi:hypothetical protein